MLQISSNFNSLDLGVALGLNFVASKYATLDDSFRLTLYKDRNGDAPAYTDLRFLGGTLALMYLHFHADKENPIVIKACRDTSMGLLSSFVATETCRAAAVKRMTESRQEEDISGSFNVYSEEHSDEDWIDDPHLEDIYGAEESPEEVQVSYAYGW